MPKDSEIYQFMRPKTTRFIEVMFVLSIIAITLYTFTDIIFFKASGFFMMIIYGIYKKFRRLEKEIAIEIREEDVLLYPPLKKVPVVISKSNLSEIFETKYHADVKYDFKLCNGEEYVFRPYAFSQQGKIKEVKDFLEKHLMKVYERL